MKYGRLIWANLQRNFLRTMLTVASVVVAFYLFATLRSVITSLDASTEVGSEARLITMAAAGFTFPLPEAHVNRLTPVEGVQSVSWANWFGGYYQDPQDFFANFAIKSATYLPMYPEMVISEGDAATFIRERDAALVGSGLMTKYGWKLGQTVTLKGTIFQGDWPFVIRAVYKPIDKSFPDNAMYFNYEYLYERGGSSVSPGWFVLQLSTPDRAAEIASTIDAQFKNSTAPTKTETERAWQAEFVTMWGNIGFLVKAIGTAIFFAILFVTANAMMMTARERVGETAILKTLGFANNTLSMMVIFESTLVTTIGGALGLLLCWATFHFWQGMNAFLPGFGVNTTTILFGLFIAVLLGLVSGAVPAWQSARLSVVNALRKVA